MLFLESENPEKDVSLYINSRGGIVTAGLAIYDTMQFIRSDVSTICVGQAASMGAVLLAAGEKGKRFCLPHARIMIHQPLGRLSGQAADMEIHAKEMLETRDRLNKILANTPVRVSIRLNRTQIATTSWTGRRPKGTVSSIRCSSSAAKPRAVHRRNREMS